MEEQIENGFWRAAIMHILMDEGFTDGHSMDLKDRIEKRAKEKFEIAKSIRKSEQENGK
jgi:hypothetical protein